jgi:serine/threonine protein kinase
MCPPSSKQPVLYPEISGFQVLEPVGKGAMSVVYLGRRVSDGLTVAVKVMETRKLEQGTLLERFILEQDILADIDNPHVVKTYGHGFNDDYAYLVMEYFENGDLDHYMERGISERSALICLKQIALALDVVHAAGVVHRDIKPHNVMLRGNSTVALTDFGVAKLMRQDLNLTRRNECFGSPAYMSPEQIRGDKLDGRSDLYSLGVVLFEMLAGRKPYIAKTPKAVFDLHINAPPPELPPDRVRYQPLINRLMVKDREQRYASAGELLADLPQYRAAK